jgi:2-methylcitrate dehydratase PrpD
MSRQPAVDTYAGLVLTTRWADIPEPARQQACVFLLDSLGVGVSGSAADTAAAVRETASGWGRGSQCSVLGSSLRLPPASAAYVNAFQVHCQEYDCLHEPATVHAMAVLTGALLAMAEREHYAPEELMLGVVLGVEVAVTLGLCATEGLRFFRPATAGLMGATAALARLQGFSDRQFRDAWGLAYSQMAGTMQAHVEGSVALPLQVAGAARAAVNAIELVEAGLSGPHDVLEGPFGYFTLFEANARPAPVLATLGQPWRVTELAHKPFPTGRAAHGTLDGLQRLVHTHAIAASDITAVRAYVPPLTKRLVGRPYQAGMPVNYARLCLQYLVPVYLRHGQLDTSCFSPQWLADKDVAAASAMVSVIDDGNPDPNALSPQRLEVEISSGHCLEQAVPATLGSPGYPLSEAQRMAKLQHCFAAGGLPQTAADKLAAMLQTPGAISSVNSMIALCTAR